MRQTILQDFIKIDKNYRECFGCKKLRHKEKEWNLFHLQLKCNFCEEEKCN